MLTSTEDRRRESISSLGSCRSGDDIDIDFGVFNLDGDDDDNHTPVPSSPIMLSKDDQPPMRERLGTMTIIAATSPEIKALNLPITPTFPTQLDFTRSNSFSGATTEPSLRIQQPTLFRAQSMRNHVSFRLDTMDDFKGFTTDLRRPSPRRNVSPEDSFYQDDGEDDLLQFLYPHEPVPRHPDQNKENIHPNLIPLKSDKQSLTTFETEADPSIVKKKGHGRRKSFHRRISYEALPSPAEIGPSPGGLDSKTPRRSNTSMDSSAFTFEFLKSDEPVVTPRCHSPALTQSDRMIGPQNLQLKAGFR